MDKPSALPVEIVREFVLKAHTDLERVKELLAQEPTVVNAVLDWGGGDWETGLGSASHMGRKDIAEFLLANGARLDIFAAAMLDQIEIVKAILNIYPNMRNAHGPHGISLLDHAQMGGAQRVLDYLATL